MESDFSAKNENTIPTYFQLLCWGGGQFGQHGHMKNDVVGVDSAFSKPITCQNWTKISSIVCGASHTVVITDKNEAYAWGNGQYGQLGCGDEEQHLLPVKVMAEDGNDSEVGSTKIAQVACGDRHTCLLTTSGQVYTCGCNFYAQMSYDHLQSHFKQNILIPRLIPDKQRVTRIACGQHHTVLLYETGQVACFGRNMYGQIGMPQEGARLDTVEAPRVLSDCFRTLVAAISAGSNHSLCIDATGNAYCWGYGRACGKKDGHLMYPTRISLVKNRGFTDGTDQVELPVKQVDGGSGHTMLLTAGGTVYGLGNNYDGQLGVTGKDGPISFAERPIAVDSEAFSSKDLSQIVCGENYSAALSEGGDVYMWGKNSHVISAEQPIGESFHQPVSIVTGRLGPGRVRQLACGTWHAAALIDPFEELVIGRDETINEVINQNHDITLENLGECNKTLNPSSSSDERVTSVARRDFKSRKYGVRRDVEPPLSIAKAWADTTQYPMVSIPTPFDPEKCSTPSPPDSPSTRSQSAHESRQASLHSGISPHEIDGVNGSVSQLTVLDEPCCDPGSSPDFQPDVIGLLNDEDPILEAQTVGLDDHDHSLSTVRAPSPPAHLETIHRQSLSRRESLQPLNISESASEKAEPTKIDVFLRGSKIESNVRRNGSRTYQLSAMRRTRSLISAQYRISESSDTAAETAGITQGSMQRPRLFHWKSAKELKVWRSVDGIVAPKTPLSSQLSNRNRVLCLPPTVNFSMESQNDRENTTVEQSGSHSLQHKMSGIDKHIRDALPKNQINTQPLPGHRTSPTVTDRVPIGSPLKCGLNSAIRRQKLPAFVLNNSK